MTRNDYSALATLGARNRAKESREKNDYYATPVEATEGLLQVEHFAPAIWECACGGGSIASVLEQHGYKVKATDLCDRGYGVAGVDFLECKEVFDGDIITNPPFGLAQEFVEKALELVRPGNRVAMFLKIQFLESKRRRNLFENTPPKTVYVSSGRLRCAKNGDIEAAKDKNAMCFAWFVWEKGYTGDPIIKWFN